MYTATYDGQLLHDPRVDGTVLTACELEGEVNVAPSLSFEIQPTHPLYGTFVPLDPRHEVVVYEDGVELFRGRILDDSSDIATTTRITCEGQVAYLNDSLVRPYGTYADTSDEPQWTTVVPGTRHSYVEWLIAQHNASTDATKRFDLVSAEVDETPLTRSSTVWPTTAVELLDKVLDPLGLVCEAGYSNGTRTLTLRRTPHMMPQPVELGTNILSFEPEDDYTSVITCIVPYPSGGSSQNPPDISTYPDGIVGNCMKQGDRIWDMGAASKYGLIEERRGYDAATADGMVQQVVADLAARTQPVSSLSAKVVDMHHADGSIPSIRLGDMLRVTSKPHHIDQWMMASKCHLDICDPSNSTWDFGAVKGSLTKSNVTQFLAVEQSMTDVIQQVAPIADEAQQAAQDAAQAASDAAAAVLAADGKTRVFTSTPTPPYSVGDIWVVGDGSILYCINEEES